MDILRKLSGKTLLGGPTQIRELVSAKNKETAVYNVIGVAHKTKSGDGDNGPWTALVGTFEAEVLAGPNAGNVYTAPVCHLPAPMDEIFFAQLENEETKSIQFALQISVVFDATAATGYTYGTKALIEVENADPLAALRNDVKALPAAKPAPEKEPEKAPTKGKGK